MNLSPSALVDPDDADADLALFDPSESDEEADSSCRHLLPAHRDSIGRRRSSLLTSVADLGGVNSFRSFTRSWQRAAGFPEAVPHRPSFVFIPGQQPLPPPSVPPPTLESLGSPPRSDSASVSRPGASLLRQHLERASSDNAGATTPLLRPDGAGPSNPSPGAPPNAPRPDSSQHTDFRERERKALDAELAQDFAPASSRHGSLFAMSPHLATPPLVCSFSSYRSYGAVPSPRVRPEMQWDHGRFEGAGDDDCPPVLVREVEQDGKMVLAVKGQSTLPQTIFNSINALIGVGILSLPLALKYSGWLWGLITLSVCAAVTAHTSRLIAKCMELDASLISFSDLAYVCFGHRARVVTAIIFTSELIAANVALVVLFADSLQLLFPNYMSPNLWKLACSVVLIPMNFMPLRLLSFTSVIGILSTFLVVTIVFVDGLIKKEAPGSLGSPATTFIFPENWLSLPLAYGLFLSPFSSHSVLPNIYRDMRHPAKFGKAVGVTFSFTYLVDLAMAVVGILMFGDGVREEITSNIIETKGYPKALTFVMCVSITIIPLSKVPLGSRPLISSAEVLFGVYGHPEEGANRVRAAVIKFLIRVFIIFGFLVIAILFPSFDSILSLMGSLFCASISVILPISFYLKLFGHEISTKERLVSIVIIAVFGIMSVIGTAFTIMPKHALRVK